MSAPYKVKIVMLGDYAVGKTSLINRYVYSVFDERYLATLGVRISKKDVSVRRAGGAQEVSLILWDLNGADGFHTVLPQYLKGAAGAILVGDLTRPESVDSLARHEASYRDANPRGVAVVALNKTDLVTRPDLGLALAPWEPGRTFWTSAKTESGVAALFEAVASLCVPGDD